MFWAWLPGPLNFLLLLIGLFMILLVLIQRGKGGGLIGALGGTGGSSPFGSRATSLRVLPSMSLASGSF